MYNDEPLWIQTWDYHWAYGEHQNHNTNRLLRTPCNGKSPRRSTDIWAIKNHNRAMTHNQTLEEDIKTFVNSFALSKELEGKKIVITGATGLLGSCMVRCLLSLYREKGIQLHVIAVIRDPQKAVAMFGEECKEITYYECDFSSSEPFLPIENTFPTSNKRTFCCERATLYCNASK